MPAQPSVTVGTTTATSISLSWTSAGSEVDSYEVMWRFYFGECSGVRGGSTTVAGDMTNYTIEGLEEYITYSITVTATNDVSSTLNVTTVRTSEAGEVISQVANSCPPYAVFYSLQLLLVLPLQLVPLAHPLPSLFNGGQWTASTAMET